MPVRNGRHDQAPDEIRELAPEFLSREMPDTESDPGVTWYDAVQAAFTGRAAHHLKQLRINTAIFKGLARFTRKNSRSSQYQQC